MAPGPSIRSKVEVRSTLRRTPHPHEKRPSANTAVWSRRKAGPVQAWSNLWSRREASRRKGWSNRSNYFHTHTREEENE